MLLLSSLCLIITPYCDLRGRIKGATRALYPVHVERAHDMNVQYYIGHKAR